MLKATTESITKGITTLFNKSIESSEVPKDWKVSTVVLIPKGGDSSKPSNYRPISLIYSQKTPGEAYASANLQLFTVYCSICFTTMGILHKKVNCVCTD